MRLTQIFSYVAKYVVKTILKCAWYGLP